MIIRSLKWTTANSCFQGLEYALLGQISFLLDKVNGANWCSKKSTIEKREEEY